MMTTSHNMRLINSSTMIVAGPTQSGKTTFVQHLLQNADIMLRDRVSKVYWICSMLPFDKNPAYQYMVGIPNSFSFVQNNSIVVVDDLMSESQNNTAITNLFTKITHHLNVFAIYITQNYFSQCKDGTCRRRNAQYLVLFKNPADISEVRYLETKMFPHRAYYPMEVYLSAVGSHPHGYLFLDFRQETEENLRVRTQCLPHELPMIVYKLID